MQWAVTMAAHLFLMNNVKFDKPPIPAMLFFYKNFADIYILIS